MKIIGLIGGTSPESTELYYRYINAGIREQLGGLHSAKLLLYSVDFGEIVGLCGEHDWPTITQHFVNAARVLEHAGADCLVIGANTMHKIADAVQAAIAIPLLHIIDATAQRIRALRLQNVGLLGTRFTMEEPFYTERMREKFGITVMTPAAVDRMWVHEMMYQELCHGKITEASTTRYRQIIEGLCIRGAEGIILGCTEIPLIVKPADYSIPLFDTTALHAAAAVEFALG